MTVSKKPTPLSLFPSMPHLTWGTAIVLWIVLSCTVTLNLLPYENKFFGNPLVTSLLFFNNLNIFISICEIILGINIKFIQKDYKARLKKFGKGKQWEGAFELLKLPLSVSDCFQGKTWALMWSTYALFDPSYQNQESFGFFIDVGNGWTTIPPCLLLNYVMIYHEHLPSWISHNFVGCIIVASYWQMLYGTIIYFLSFIFNKRWHGHNVASMMLFVASTNGVWVVFPAIAIYSAFCILRDDNYSVFLSH